MKTILQSDGCQQLQFAPSEPISECGSNNKLLPQKKQERKRQESAEEKDGITLSQWEGQILSENQDVQGEQFVSKV